MLSQSIRYGIKRVLRLSKSLEFRVLIGPILAIIVAFIGYGYGLDEPMFMVLGICAWMIAWWLNEVVKMGITALLPIALFPLFGIESGTVISSFYFSDGVVVCWGSMLMATAIKKYNLHKRFADYFLHRVSRDNHAGLLFVFIFATGSLSMWMSNTATAALMTPLAQAVFNKLKGNQNLLESDRLQLQRTACAIDFGIAYGALLGGIATLTGTGTNLVLEGILLTQFGEEGKISFVSWFLLSAPLSLVQLAMLWLVLAVWFINPSVKIVVQQLFETFVISSQSPTMGNQEEYHTEGVDEGHDSRAARVYEGYEGERGRGNSLQHENKWNNQQSYSTYARTVIHRLRGYRQIDADLGGSGQCHAIGSSNLNPLVHGPVSDEVIHRADASNVEPTVTENTATDSTPETTKTFGQIASEYGSATVTSNGNDIDPIDMGIDLENASAGNSVLENATQKLGIESKMNDEQIKHKTSNSDDESPKYARSPDLSYNVFEINSKAQNVLNTIKATRSTETATDNKLDDRQYANNTSMLSQIHHDDEIDEIYFFNSGPSSAPSSYTGSPLQSPSRKRAVEERKAEQQFSNSLFRTSVFNILQRSRPYDGSTLTPRSSPRSQRLARSPFHSAPVVDDLAEDTSKLPLTFPQWVVILDFALMAVLWMTRDPPGNWGWSNLCPEPDYVTDGTVAALCVVILFSIPSYKSVPSMSWISHCLNRYHRPTSAPQNASDIHLIEEYRNPVQSDPTPLNLNSNMASSQINMHSLQPPSLHPHVQSSSSLLESPSSVPTENVSSDALLSTGLDTGDSSRGNGKKVDSSEVDSNRGNSKKSDSDSGNSNNVDCTQADNNRGGIGNANCKGDDIKSGSIQNAYRSRRASEPDLPAPSERYIASQPPLSRDLPWKMTSADCFVLTWTAFETLNWDIVFLLGGGFALSKGFQESGLSQAITMWVRRSGSPNIAAVVIGASVTATTITNFMSNIAVANILLPAMACLGPAHGVGPLYILQPVTFAISLGFLSPIASPCNAMVMANGNLTMKMMFQVGAVCTCVFLTTTLVYCLLVLPFIAFRAFELTDAAKNICGVAGQ